MKKKILIIDDSRAMRLIVRRTLRQAGLGEHEVVEACDGREGYDLICKGAPDLVLSDWNMPEMSGFELLTELRRNSLNVKFGFVTTEGTAEMRAAATEAGALFMITKPFTPETFRQALTSVLR
jgi:two-component system chemotaxis response regulator CheY